MDGKAFAVAEGSDEETPIGVFDSVLVAVGHRYHDTLSEALKQSGLKAADFLVHHSCPVPEDEIFIIYVFPSLPMWSAMTALCHCRLTPTTHESPR